MARPPREKNHSANIQEEIEAEARSSTITVIAAAIAPIEPITWNLERISTWKKLVRRTVWINRGIRRLLSHAEQQKRQTPELGPTEPIRVNGKEIQVEKLSPEELHEAELLIFKQLQRERFPKVYEALKNGSAIHPKEKVANLLPV